MQKPIDYSKMLKPLADSLIENLEQDAEHWERKARNARKGAATMRKLVPQILEMLKPPVFKPPTKKQLAKMRKMYGSPYGASNPYIRTPVPTAPAN